MRTTTRWEPGRWDGALVFIESRPSRLFLLQNGDETKHTLAVLSLFRNAEPDETITDDEELLTGWHNIAMANLYSPAFFTWICCPLSLANSSPGSVVLSPGIDMGRWIVCATLLYRCDCWKTKLELHTKWGCVVCEGDEELGCMNLQESMRSFVWAWYGNLGRRF